MAETKIIGIETKVLILETDGNNNHFLLRKGELSDKVTSLIKKDIKLSFLDWLKLSPILSKKIIKSKSVTSFNLDGTFNKTYNSIKEAAKELNQNSAEIYRVIQNGKELCNLKWTY